jgi:hypothetical protein
MVCRGWWRLNFWAPIFVVCGAVDLPIPESFPPPFPLMIADARCTTMMRCTLRSRLKAAHNGCPEMEVRAGGHVGWDADGAEASVYASPAGRRQCRGGMLLRRPVGRDPGPLNSQLLKVERRTCALCTPFICLTYCIMFNHGKCTACGACPCVSAGGPAAAAPLGCLWRWVVRRLARVSRLATRLSCSKPRLERAHSGRSPTLLLRLVVYVVVLTWFVQLVVELAWFRGG